MSKIKTKRYEFDVAYSERGEVDEFLRKIERKFDAVTKVIAETGSDAGGAGWPTCEAVMAERHNEAFVAFMAKAGYEEMEIAG